MRVVLIGTYELGRQSFGLASAARWLTDAGHAVTCTDLSQTRLEADVVRAADAIVFYVPMHTATRIAAQALTRVRALNANARLGFFGLYAPVNEDYLRSLGADFVLGGEAEPALVSAVAGDDASLVTLDKLAFRLPDRSGLPALDRYAHLHDAHSEQRVVGYTEASRGCKYHCRHCPVVPVYEGRFFIVQPDVVLADIAQQVEAGAEHITFGDPDFFNAPRHAVSVVTALHERFPGLTYDVTIKVEHLVKHAPLLETLRDTGCAFATTAVESFDDDVLELLDKGHSHDDFARALAHTRELGLVLAPTFVAFGPWTTIDSYRSFLRRLRDDDLVDATASVQLGLRLLIPAGSLLYERESIREVCQPFDPAALQYPWTHPDPRVDALQRDVMSIAQSAGSRRELFERVWARAYGSPYVMDEIPAPVTIPFLTEPWYC